MAPFALFADVAMIDAALPQIGGAADDAFVRFDIDRAADVAEAADRFGASSSQG